MNKIRNKISAQFPILYIKKGEHFLSFVIFSLEVESIIQKSVGHLFNTNVQRIGSYFSML